MNDNQEQKLESLCKEVQETVKKHFGEECDFMMAVLKEDDEKIHIQSVAACTANNYKKMILSVMESIMPEIYNELRDLIRLKNDTKATTH